MKPSNSLIYGNICLACLLPMASCVSPSSRTDDRIVHVTVDALGKPAPWRGYAWAFERGFQISHYLDTAATLQAMPEQLRVSRLQELARDVQRGSEVFVLCRMLFEAAPNADFRPPMIGMAGAFDDKCSEDWPLEPIALTHDMPVLVVRGYFLVGGAPEQPEGYLRYCLMNCRWRPSRFKCLSSPKQVEILKRFVAEHPSLAAHQDWIFKQARSPVEPF